MTNRTKNSWQAMKRRCNEKGYPGYSGIKYDPKWESFEGFLQDMGERPEGMTLDRYPNQSGNYCKKNCRWATPRQQSCNLRTNNPVPGVHWSQTRWRAAIRIHGKMIRLYNGKDFFEAVCARKSAECKENK